jgi:hypothetical protein
MHCVAAARKTFPVWHCAQAIAACAPISGNPVFEWSNVPPQLIAFTAWQLWQSVPNPAWRWFGDWAPSKSDA